MTQWTEQQKMVIRSDERKLICSAAAGSGKTAVMIERVLRLIQDGADPEAFLIVTFTNAAAAEMKEKIRNRLREERRQPKIREAYNKVDMMEISTIHSFCQRLIRQEFQAAGVDPMFRICEAGIRQKLFDDAFCSACDSLLTENDPEFENFRKKFENDETLRIVSSVYTFMMSLPDPEEWLEMACEGVPEKIDSTHPWFRYAGEIVRDKLDTAAVLLRQQYRMFGEEGHLDRYREAWTKDSELFHVKQLWADGKDVSPDLLDMEFCRLPTVRGLNIPESDWKSRYEEIRKKLKSLNDDISKLIFPDPERIGLEFLNIRESLSSLRKIITRTMENFDQAKMKMRVLDFQDLEHKSLRILRLPEYRKSVQKRWQYIFVDECQDVSAVQDAIIQAMLGNENSLFMVGDVKQSIYRFRLADPMIFMRRSHEYMQPDAEGDCLSLQTNFRSRPEILETANTVFRDIMRAETAEMDYTPQEELIPGRKTDGDFPVSVDLLKPNPAMEYHEILAEYISEQVRELKNEKFEFRDMVILMQKASSDAPKLVEALTARNIPVFYDGGADFYALDEVQSFLRLLELLQNPQQDLPLISSLRNPPFMFDEQELAEIRLCASGRKIAFWKAFDRCAAMDTPVGKRCAAAKQKLEEWRELSKVTPLGTFMFRLVGDSQHYTMAGASPAGRTAQKNLRLLCMQAEAAQDAGIYTIRDFLLYTEDQASGGDARAAAPLAANDNVIRIMTMHKSKGLQFPVVFCLGLDKPMKGRQEPSVLTDAELGITLKYKDPVQRIARKTAADEIFAWKKEREERAERIRLLYVAMTRAQERMFLAGITEERGNWQLPAGVHRVQSAQDYLDWIVPALRDSEKLSTGCAHRSTHWKIRTLEINQQENVENAQVIHSLENWLNSLILRSPVDGLWKDSQEEAVNPERMIKRSVTAMIRKAEQGSFDPEDEEETPDGKRIPERFTRALRKYDMSRLPPFMTVPQEKQGAWRGTVMHRFLSLADLERIRSAGKDPELEIIRMRDEMCSSGVFRQEEAEVIDTADIAGFFTSRIGHRMLASPEIHREWGFNLYREEERLLVQGVIDCAFLEDGCWVLLDYKTDHVEDPEAFCETYRPQLTWYADALEKLTGRKVREKYLYALSTGQVYPV